MRFLKGQSRRQRRHILKLCSCVAKLIYMHAHLIPSRQNGIYWICTETHTHTHQETLSHTHIEGSNIVESHVRMCGKIKCAARDQRGDRKWARWMRGCAGCAVLCRAVVAKQSKAGPAVVVWHSARSHKRDAYYFYLATKRRMRQPQRSIINCAGNDRRTARTARHNVAAHQVSLSLSLLLLLLLLLRYGLSL